MAYIKEYTIPLAPISWKRPGLKKKQFYDQQRHDKLSCGLYLNQCHGNDPQFTSPIHVEVTFYVPQPKATRDRRSCWSAAYPDIDNLLGFLFDTINNSGIIWTDDRIIASLISKKIYDKNPRTHLIIRSLE